MASPENSPDDSRPDANLMRRLQEKFGGTGAIISIAGPDGAGKTTLANQLVDAFTAADLPVRRIHCYTWYKNLLVMPFRLARLKNRGEIIILDRSIFDNIIELARKAHLPKGFFGACLKGLSACYIAFEYKILLSAPADELASRRPEELASKVSRQLKLYTELGHCAGYHSVVSDGPILLEVLQIISRPKTQLRSGNKHGR